MKKPTLKELQQKWLPIYTSQPKPVQIKPQVCIGLARSVEIVLHPMMKGY